MKVIATVLYEDSMLPGPDNSYPLHDLVMRFVEDEINGPTWLLRKLVFGNPRRGVGNVLREVRDTDRIAGAGELYLLVDRDVIAEHLGLPSTATDAQVVSALHAMSDAAHKLHPYFLLPNLEGLLRAMRDCDPHLLPGSMQAALGKRNRNNDRDLVLREAGKAARLSLRQCVAASQPGLVALAAALAATIRAAGA